MCHLACASFPAVRARTGWPPTRSRLLPSAGVLLLAVLTGPVLPQIASGQTIRGVLRGIGRELDRAARPDSSSGRPSDGAGVANGGALRVVEQRIEGSDSLAQHFARDTGLTVVHSTGACGVARACVAGWDLRVTRVALPGPLVPVGARVVVTAAVENRGRQPAPAAELRLCVAQLPLRGCGLVARGDARDAVALPPLGPGERVVVRHALALPVSDREASGIAAAAEIDPDRTLGERAGADNAAVSAPATTRLPVLQLLAVDLPADPRAGSAFPVTLAVRNVSTVAPSPATELQLSGALMCGTPRYQLTFGGGPHRLAVPALAPRQTVTYRLLVPDAARCRTVRPAQLTLALDPDHRSAWGPGQERELRRPYGVR